MEFLTEYPFPKNNIDTGRARNELPGLVLKQGLELIFHCSNLLRIKKSGFICFYNRRDRRSGKEIKALGGQAKAGLGACAHAMGVGWCSYRNIMRWGTHRSRARRNR
jgi:hypothetical protein